MSASNDPGEGCRHDRAPLRRLGKIRHERTGKCVYVLVCTACGFAVTTAELRRLRSDPAPARDLAVIRPMPRWAPTVNYRPVG